MSDLQKYKNKQLQNPEFKAEYDRSRPEFNILQALIDARISQNLTQKELAKNRYPPVKYQQNRKWNLQPNNCYS